MDTHCPLDYDTRDGELILKYEFLNFEEILRISPGSYFFLSS